MKDRVELQERTSRFSTNLAGLLIVFACCCCAKSPGEELTVPVVADGETKIISEFKDPDLWIREDLWVETEFDSDGDGKLDRMHVDVTRPRQTESEEIKLPVIYVTSPYFAGTGAKGRVRSSPGARMYAMKRPSGLQTGFWSRFRDGSR